MTPEERASQCIQAAFKHWSKDPKLALMDDELLHIKIVAEIRAAVEEAKLSVHAFHDGENLQSYREGKSLAYEDAAKIADDEYECGALAERIRARAKVVSQ